MDKQDSGKQSWKMFKSRIGEALIEELLNQAGNKVRRFGQEWRTTAFQELSPAIFQWVNLSERFRMKPDLAILNREGKVQGIEVKFLRTEEHLSYLDEKKYFEKLKTHWPGTQVIIVTLEPSTVVHLNKCHIQVLDPSDIDQDNYYFRCPIYNIDEWGVTKKLCANYEQLIRKLPADELINRSAY